MVCRKMQLAPMQRRCDELVPIALRETVCVVRKAAPARYAALLREHGVEIEDHDIECRHNLDASWPDCPLYTPR